MRHIPFIYPTIALTWAFALACASDDGSAAADASESGTTDESEGGDGTTSPAGESTGRPPSTSSSDDDSSETGMEPPDAYDGDWCGTISAGSLDVGPISARVRFAPSNGGPSAFAGWVTAGGDLQVAIYDLASASWGDPVTIQTGYPAFALDDGPLAAVDEQGNAIFAYPMQEPEPHMVVQRYDAAAGTWAQVELTGSFEYPWLESISMTPAGHAALVVKDGNFGPKAAWFLDAATGQWSEPSIHPEAILLPVAQDPETGDAALGYDTDLGVLTLQHRVAATGMLTDTEVDLPAYAQGVASIGDGEFVLLSRVGGFQENGQIHAHYFDGSEWQPHETIGTGYDLGPVRILGSADGRAVASWNDSQRGAYARVFDPETGWGDLLTANPPSGSGGEWADHRVALDDEGLFTVWSSFGAFSGIRTWARRFEGATADAPFELDPAQPAPNSRIKLLTTLGVARARALWGLDEEGGSTSNAYACHTPVSGWSAPTPVPGYLLRVEDRPGGDLVVMTADAALATRVEYFAAM